MARPTRRVLRPVPFLTHRDKLARYVFIISYCLLALAGATVPLQLLAWQDVGATPLIELWWTMSVWLGFGGTVCAIGSMFRRWVGEYVGLPFVFSSLFVFGLLQANISGWSPVVIPSVSLLWALGGFAVTRWRQTTHYYTISRLAEDRETLA